MNIPNALTILRFFLIPVFCYFYFSNLENNLLIALIIFVIAGITDVLDGFIARHFHQVTELGKMLDPLADKCMLIAVLICLVSTNLIPLWILLLMILKEVVMIIGSIYLYLHKVNIVIPSNRYGKIATVFFYLAICLVLLNVNELTSIIALYVAVISAIVAFFKYYNIAKEKFVFHND